MVIDVWVKGTTAVPKLSNYTWIAALLGCMLAACDEGPKPVLPEGTNTASERAVQIFEGLYAAGPEVSSFVTCAMNELPGPGKGYWLVPNEEFSQLVGNPAGITMGDIAGTYGPYDVFAIYVRFEASLTAEPGQGYGPSGLYRGKIQVTRALAASRRWVGSSDPQRRVFTGCGR